jgi:very-short-patch-repair endonuclease
MRALRGQGWTPLRVWEHELRDTPAAVIAKLASPRR